jgi:hypothetical protein
MTTSRDNAMLVLAGAMAGAGIVLGWQKLKLIPPQKVDPETDYTMGHQLVWNSIGGAMNAAMVYTGDRLHLYKALRELCEKTGSSVTAIDLAQHTVRRLARLRLGLFWKYRIKVACRVYSRLNLLI